MDIVYIYKHLKQLNYLAAEKTKGKQKQKQKQKKKKWRRFIQVHLN